MPIPDRPVTVRGLSMAKPGSLLLAVFPMLTRVRLIHWRPGGGPTGNPQSTLCRPGGYCHALFWPGVADLRELARTGGDRGSSERISSDSGRRRPLRDRLPDLANSAGHRRPYKSSQTLSGGGRGIRTPGPSPAITGPTENLVSFYERSAVRIPFPPLPGSVLGVYSVAA